MFRLLKSYLLVLVFMPAMSASADDMFEQRDILFKKAKFLRDQKTYIEKKARKNPAWKDFSQAVNQYLNIYDELVSDSEVSKLSEAHLAGLQTQIDKVNLLNPMQLPKAGEKEAAFGAYYTRLKYYPEWDKQWRIGPDADVVVRFGDGRHHMIFWRGTNYIPHWVTDNDIWYNNEFNETWPTRGCSEPMSDKQCRYSHVRIIESHPARVVVHWRYALNDVDYKIAWPDKMTGWGDWTDEYYVIYPDAVGTRVITLHTSHFGDDERDTDDLGHEWHEGIIVYSGFTMPEEALHIDAVHVANMNGEKGIWSWNKPGEPDIDIPEGSNIAMMNVRSARKPFVISPQGCDMDVYEGCQNGSRFRWRDHWPTTMEDVVGRNASGRKASHGSFFHITNIPVHKRRGDAFTKVLLHGMTEKGDDIQSLVPLAKSWLDAPELKLVSNHNKILYQGYDSTERAYVIKINSKQRPDEIEVNITADRDRPLINPALILDGRLGDEMKTKIGLNGSLLTEGKDYHSGLVTNLEKSRRIIWLNKTLTDNTVIKINLL